MKTYTVEERTARLHSLRNRQKAVAESQPLLECLSRIREVTGVGNGPTLKELPEAIRRQMTERPSKELINQMIRSGK